ncbi:uncharacterized protein LOC105840290 [Monomorium pharaonis]|uniref:uncharacterized protein LOC105840290 n=1 Tax=Monomorium pharaonis TaxID=307658 RepID=UPI00063F01EF|nr:uncharacterized protein LOC105840290 [Monomorium pharaonis]
MRIARWCGFGSDIQSAEIHGFADASNNAYAAAVYIKIVSAKRVTITLLVGKSKVAPVKPLSVLRLELSAALFLARLIDFVRGSVGYRELPYFCWTDSTIVLAWVTQHPSRWKTFVAHRVSDIQSRLSNAEWRHVLTEDNPADCAFRGIFGDEIVNHPLWWHGLAWLRFDAHKWPSTYTYLIPQTSVEEKVISLQCSEHTEIWDLSTRYSSWPKLIRVTAYLSKFVNSCRAHLTCHNQRSFSVTPNLASDVILSASDCNNAKTFWLKRIQATLFPEELKSLAKNRSISTRSSLLSLSPFLDKDGLLRVGRRLRRAPYPFSARHPILLAAHPLVPLIVTQAHLRALHAGSQFT